MSTSICVCEYRCMYKSVCILLYMYPRTALSFSPGARPITSTTFESLVPTVDVRVLSIRVFEHFSANLFSSAVSAPIRNKYVCYMLRVDISILFMCDASGIKGYERRAQELST